ncbi:hypothetical protein [Kitasatospora purpeofusca]|uniref:hypothetical protein n=1 Tax=Kitasatospora purpeofusca TaxID=67352 RepID=UPI0022524982|nr:hypothetical protein [Kitasatospora purpeofusca]MCX4758745.1 hypothetical protein [Kitasatospora purpeofusca]WSR30824.1 hypothetical protein OG715_07470 [Kitasatospora purpeofusca]
MKSSARPRPYNLAVRATVLTWVCASAATAVACAAVVMYDAVRHHRVASGELTVVALAVFSLRFASSRWDKITDADVLHRLRLADSPCGAGDLARHLVRRRGPVHLSLRRLSRAGLVVPVDSVDGTVRYTCV